MSEPLSVLAAARDSPAAPALVTDAGQWSWAQLAEQVSGVARWLSGQLQSPPGAALPPPVAVTGCNRVDHVVACYALIELGVPFALLHPRWTDVERREALAQLGSPLEIGASWRLPAVAPGLPEAPSLGKLSPPGLDRCLAVLFTSGTSGRPKGAVLSRRAFVASAAASEANLGRRQHQRWLLSLPIAHVGGLSILTRALIARGCMVLEDSVLEESTSFRADRFHEILRRQRVTLASVVPTQLYRLLETGPEEDPPHHLRAVLVGGARSTTALLDRARAHGWPVLATYGLTEACSQVATQRLEAKDAAAGVGPPLDGIELRLCGHGERTADGFVIGEIELRGAMLFDGYLPLSESPSSGDSDWFATGDVGFLDDRGNLHLLDRRSDLLVSGGENVYPSEVEDALEAHPAVARACVFGVDDAEWGQRVAAVLVPAGPQGDGGLVGIGPVGIGPIEMGPVDMEEVRRFLEERLASYKRPRLRLWADQLPTSPNGKVDREACRSLALASGLEPWE